MDLFGEMKVLTIDDCPVHYWISGAVGAPWIILFHGGQIDHTMFAPQMDLLTRNHRVLAFDVRGHGCSQPPGGTLSYRSIAQDGLALLDREGVSEAVFIGHSMGGCAVQEVLRMAPQRVKTAVLIGSPSITAGLTASMRNVSYILGFFAWILPQNLLSRFMEGAANAYSIDPDVRTYIRAATRRISKRTFRQMMTMVQEGYNADPAYRSPCRLLLACGDADIPKIRQGMTAWAEHEPAAHLEVIPHAGHNANQDNPVEFNRVLSAFLAEVP